MKKIIIFWSNTLGTCMQPCSRCIRVRQRHTRRILIRHRHTIEVGFKFGMKFFFLLDSYNMVLTLLLELLSLSLNILCMKRCQLSTLCLVLFLLKKKKLRVHGILFSMWYKNYVFSLWFIWIVKSIKPNYRQDPSPILDV